MHALSAYIGAMTATAPQPAATHKRHWLILTLVGLAIAGITTVVWVNTDSGKTATGRTLQGIPASNTSIHAETLLPVTAVIDALRGAGFAVTDVKTSTDVVVGVDSVDLKLNGITGGITMFANVGEASDWLTLCEMFGGIAVVGPTWDVSLDSRGESATPTQSRALVQVISKRLGVDRTCGLR